MRRLVHMFLLDMFHTVAILKEMMFLVGNAVEKILLVGMHIQQDISAENWLQNLTNIPTY